MTTKVLIVLTAAMLQGANVDAFSNAVWTVGGAQFTYLTGKTCDPIGARTTDGLVITKGYEYRSINAARAECANTKACSGAIDLGCNGGHIRGPTFLMCRAGSIKACRRRCHPGCVFAKKGDRGPQPPPHRTSKTDCSSPDCDPCLGNSHRRASTDVPWQGASAALPLRAETCRALVSGFTVIAKA